MEKVILTILGFAAAFWATKEFVPEEYKKFIFIVLTVGVVVVAVRFFF